MALLDLLNIENKKIGQVDIPEEIAAGEVDQSLLHAIVKWQLAGRRQGTHMTKTKGLVSGGGKKPFKQKGTGNARQGSTRSPLMPGGGTTFGPQPRDYSYNMPKKMRKAAFKMALTHLYLAKKITVVDELKVDGKTNKLNKALVAFGHSKAVVSDSASNVFLSRAGRNLENYVVTPVVGLNVYDLLKYDGLICTKNSLPDLFEKAGVGAK